MLADEKHSDLQAALDGAQFAVFDLLSESSPLAAELNAAGKLGGYFCLANSKGFPLLIASCGNPDEEKLERYLAFCQEKARRLGSHPEHTFSLQSRDEEKDHYGGAVRAGDHIASFSGFPERLDEVVAVLALYWLDAVEFEEIRPLLAGNPYLELLTDEYLKHLCGL
ncbi:MAG: hypothetical protein V4682_04170 [Patescibacteria group bacterium]